MSFKFNVNIVWIWTSKTDNHYFCHTWGIGYWYFQSYCTDKWNSFSSIGNMSTKNNCVQYLKAELVSWNIPWLKLVRKLIIAYKILLYTYIVCSNRQILGLLGIHEHLCVLHLVKTIFFLYRWVWKLFFNVHVSQLILKHNQQQCFVCLQIFIFKLSMRKDLEH